MRDAVYACKDPVPYHMPPFHMVSRTSRGQDALGASVQLASGVAEQLIPLASSIGAAVAAHRLVLYGFQVGAPRSWAG